MMRLEIDPSQKYVLIRRKESESSLLAEDITV